MKNFCFPGLSAVSLLIVAIREKSTLCHSACWYQRYRKGKNKTGGSKIVFIREGLITNGL